MKMKIQSRLVYKDVLPEAVDKKWYTQIIEDIFDVLRSNY